MKPNKFHISRPVRGCNIERCRSIKYVGVQIDELLSSKTHIEFIKGKLSQTLGILGKLSRYLNQKELIKTYYAFFIHTSDISYGLLGWGSVNKTTLKTIQILQNKALRIISLIRFSGTIMLLTICCSLNTFYSKLRIYMYNLQLAKFTYMSSQSFSKLFPFFRNCA